MLGKKRACHAITCQVEAIVEAKVLGKAPITFLAENFIIKDMPPQTSPLYAPSPFASLEPLGDKIVEATRHRAMRLFEKSSKVHTTIYFLRFNIILIHNRG